MVWRRYEGPTMRGRYVPLTGLGFNPNAPPHRSANCLSPFNCAARGWPPTVRTLNLVRVIQRVWRAAARRRRLRIVHLVVMRMHVPMAVLRMIAKYLI
jgi:hypothetical protein